MFVQHTVPEENKAESAMLCVHNHALTSEAFVPLSKRLGKSFSKEIQNLKKILLASDFEDYIETIESLKIINGSLWLITNSPMHRSLLEHRFVPIFKEAFEVEEVRIISQI